MFGKCIRRELQIKSSIIINEAMKHNIISRNSVK